MENGFVTQAVGCKSGERHFLPTPARFFDRGEVRSGVLRRDREVFEGEEPFQVIAYANQGPLQ
jgi:hypothetical protein